MSQQSAISLSELTGTISKVIAANFYNRTFWVTAEIINLKFYPQKGYYFLDLIEKDPVTNSILTSIKASAWSQAVKKIAYFERVTGQKFDNNMRVLLQVGVEYHISYGLKLNILDVDPAFTLGNLEQQKQDTLARLLTENAGFISFLDGEYRTYNKLLSLRPVIQHIALIGSPGTDGFLDFKHELENNQFGYKFRVDEYPAQVQGKGMERGIVQKLVDIFTSGLEYDVVVLVRGGGSQTDFLIFDSYDLGRAIAKFPIPVFTGIGHTRNESISDMMALMPTKTPTKVAQTILAHNRAFEESLHIHIQKIRSGSVALMNIYRINMEHYKRSVLQLTKDYINTAALAQSSLFAVITRSAQQLLQISGSNLAQLEKQVNLLSPSAILKRGYALVYHDKKLVTGTGIPTPGSVITTVMAESTFNSIITTEI